MRKKIFIFLLAIVAGTGMLSASSGTCGSGLKWNLDTGTGVMEISGKGAMTNYTSNSDCPWYEELDKIKTLKIGDGVTSIGDRAFEQAYYLKTITFGTGLTTIGKGAFSSCYELTAVGFPAALKTIGDEAFYYCDKLVKVTFQNQLTTIGDNAFQFCPISGNLVIPNSVTSIGSYAFTDLKTTSITIGENVTSIGLSAFTCGVCKQFVFNAINCDDFDYNYSQFQLSNYVEDDDENPYRAVKITVGGKVKRLPAYFTREISHAVWVSAEKATALKEIGENAFYNQDSLVSLVLPSSVTTIGAYAFSKCSNLASVTLPASLKEMGYEVFTDCSNLSSVTFTNGLKKVGERAFYRSGLTSLALPASLDTICPYAFSVTKINSLTIPEGVKHIDEYAFSQNELLETVYYNAPSCSELKGWLGYYGSYNTTKPKKMVVGKKVKEIPADFINGFESFTEIVLPDGIEVIGTGAFYKCTCFPAKLTLPNTLKTIGGSAFGYCKVDTVVLPKSVETIGNYAFGEILSSPAKVVYVSSPNPPALGTGVFPQKSCVYIPYALMDAYIANEQWAAYKLYFVKEDGSQVIAGSCGKNARWTYSQKDSVLTISGSGTMSGYTVKNSTYNAPWAEYRKGVKKVVVTDGITNIGNYAFWDFGSLREVEVGKDCSTCGSGAFESSSGKLTLVTFNTASIPAGVNSSFNSVMKVIPAEAYGSWADAGNSVRENFRFVYNKNEYSGSCGESLTWTANIKDSTFVIKGDGNMTAYSQAYKIPYVPFEKAVRKLTLSKGQTSVSANAFAEMKNLRMSSLALPAGLKSVGSNAFPAASVTGLKEIHPDNAKPPVLANSNVFGEKDLFKVLLPLEHYTTYRSASNWKEMQLEIIPQDVYSGSIGDSIQWELVVKDSTLTIDGKAAVPGLSSYNAYPWAVLASRIRKVVIKEHITNIIDYSAFEAESFDIKTVLNYSPYIFVEKGSNDYGRVAKNAQTVHNYAVYSGSCGKSLTWTFNAEEGILTISGTGAMSYTKNPWDTYKNYIKTVTLQDGITSIASGAFSRCENLKTVYNYSPYVVIVKGSGTNGVGDYADEVYNLAKEYKGTCGENLTWTVNTQDSVLTVSGAGAMTSAPWYGLFAYIKTAVIKEGITSILRNAFPDENETQYQLPQIVHNYSSLVIRSGSGDSNKKEGIYYIYWAKEVHNYYTHTGDCTDDITWSFRDGVLTVSGKGRLNYNDYYYTPWHNYTIDTVIVNVEDTYVSDKFFPTSAQIIIGKDIKQIAIRYEFDKVKALSDKTSISIISDLSPFDPSQYYDMDGDGKMEIYDRVEKKSGYENGQTTYLYDVNIWSSPTGVLVKDNLHAITHPMYNKSKLSYLHSNNDGTLDWLFYYWEDTGKCELIESSANDYVAKDIGAVLSKETTFFMPVALDADLDGRMDFYSNEGDFNHYIHYRQPDGSYMKSQMEIVTDTTGLEEAVKRWMCARDFIKGTYWIPAGVLGAVKRSGIFQSIDKAVDVNQDGWTDLVSSTQGSMLLNIGDNRFVPAQYPGKITTKDFNGDGISDCIIFNEDTKTVSVKIYGTDGGYTSQELIQNDSINNIWCYDFDNDGDTDVLLPLDWTEKSGYAFLVFFRNDGNNTFKKIENAFDNPIRHFRFMDCKDVDNDGKYEIIATDSVMQTYSNGEYVISKGDYYIVRYNDKYNVSVDAEPFIRNSMANTNSKTNHFLMADFNNDGKLDYWYNYDRNYALSHFYPSKTNTKPAKMSKPKTELNEDRKMLLVSWNRGSDKESPALDLTYNLRIGTKSGEGDIWFAAANADGTQRNILGGNAGNNLRQWVNVADWAVGDYYIAVQAVDPNNLGGAWSDELVYHHNIVPSQFWISHTNMTSADTLQVQLCSTVNKDYTYNWNFGEDAVVLAKTGQNYQIAYNTPGVKTVSLNMKAKGGASSAVATRTVVVYPVRFDDISDGYGSYCDMDMDGIVDCLRNDDGGGFYRGNGDGSFNKLAKSYNASFNTTGAHGMCYIDYNMDGLPDVLCETNKGNLMLNRDDFDLTFETHDFVCADKNSNGNESKGQMSLYFDYDSGMADLNGDGYLDYYYHKNMHCYYIYGEDSDGKVADQWTAVNILNPEMGIPQYDADLNNDGLPDFLVYSYENKQYGYVIYLQQTDGSFRKHGHIVLKNSSISDIADLNNDGYLDLIVISDKKTIMIYLGDEYLSYSQVRTVSVPEEYIMKGSDDAGVSYVSAKHDFDNNGYTDMFISVTFDAGHGMYHMFVGYYYIAYMYSDDKMVYQSAYHDFSYPFIDLTGDGVPDFDNSFMRSRITNEAPAVPKNLRMTEENGAVRLMWDAAADKETPAAQMRYNISVKKKGAKVGEENAFVISPMNGLRDEAAVIPDYPYKRGTHTYIPYRCFETGQEYEFQIQAIDAWNAHSPMSAPVTFKVQKNTTYQPGEPTSVSTTCQQKADQPRKVMIDGVIYIIRGGKAYTLQGQEMN